MHYVYILAIGAIPKVSAYASSKHALHGKLMKEMHHVVLCHDSEVQVSSKS